MTKKVGEGLWGDIGREREVGRKEEGSGREYAGRLQPLASDRN